MEIRKGPWGQFVVDTVIGKINIYAKEIITFNLNSTFLGIYVSPSLVSDNIEISYDCTGLTSVLEDKFSNIDRNTLRKATGDLFLTFLRCLDLLIPLGGINLADKYIFWDDNNNKFKLCNNPCIDDSIDLSLSCLGNGNIESILNNGIFKSILSNDEINTISTAINKNDENLLEDISLKIKSSDPEQILFSNKQTKKNIKYRYILSTVLIIFAILSFIIGHPILWIISLILSLTNFALTLLQAKETNEIENTTTSNITTNRKNILFDEENTLNNKTISCLILQSKESINGAYIKKALYTSNITLGSDKFLSDIYIDDKSIFAIHAEITKQDSSYYLTDLSNDNSTFIDNRRIEPNKKYEIKPGQLLRFGNYDFELIIGF